MTSLADADALGEMVAKQLVEGGARAILDEVNKERAIRDAALTKSKADKGLALPVSIAGSSAAASGDGVSPKESGVPSPSTSSPVSSPAPSTTPTLPPGHPPIPSFHIIQPIKVPGSTIDDATPLLPASHPPILVTPAPNVETPSHCLRPSSPVTAKPKDGKACLRARTPEVLESFFRHGKGEIDLDASGALGGEKRKREVAEDGPASLQTGSSRKRRAMSFGRGRDMQG